MRRRLLLATVFALSPVSALAQAQQPAALEDVVVTASTRAQRVVEAPASISVVTAETLANRPNADLTDAFEFISYVRLQHQVKQMKKGQQADNLIDPASLSSFERLHLKEAFAIIRKTQGTLAYLYRTDVTS